MASQRLKRTMRQALTAGAVMAAVSLTPAPALADPSTPPPPPKTASEALKQYQALAKKTEQLNEDLLNAQIDLKRKQAQLTKATADLKRSKQMVEQAAQREEQFRGQVDTLAGASFEGARFNQLSALFTGTNAQDFLDRASALNVLASGNAKVLDGLAGAVTEAEQGRNLAADAQNRAAEAKTTAQGLVTKITKQQAEVQAQGRKVKETYNHLSGADQDSLTASPADIDFLAPPGAAGTAMKVALQQLGDPYVWGAAGPNEFDCSGLTMYAYRAAGVSLPHSARAQYQMGTPVSMNDLKPGDLLFYGGSAGSIHHVTMYIGDGKIVHASTSGVPVKIDTLSGGGSDFFGAKRMVSG